MKTRDPWYGLIPLSTLVVGGAAVLLVATVTFFLFASYVFQVRRNAVALLNDARWIADGKISPRSAVTVGRSFSKRFFRQGFVVVFVDETHRVTVFPEQIVLVRSRVDRSDEPHARGLSSRLVLAFAAACGLQKLRTNAGALEIDASVNEIAFVNSVKEYEPALCIALAFVVVVAVLGMKMLTDRALRPLWDVTVALERLASGDFTVQFVPAQPRRRLSALASAYNGAVAQVERAFGERDRAQASMRRFIADAGHQLRTPLTVIRGYIGILRQEGERSDIDPALNMMHQQCLLIGSMLERLILLERWEEDASPCQVRIDLGEFVREIVEPIARSQPDRSICLLAAEELYAIVDPSDLRHAVTNILENALKYTRGAIVVKVLARDGCALVEIADEGPGMKAHEAERAFERFFRGDRRYVGGSGLGLAIAKRAVERGRGKIFLETSPASGSIFTVALRQDDVVGLAVRVLEKA